MKRLYTLLTIALLLLVLAACSSATPAPVEPTDAPADEPTEAVAEATDAPADEPVDEPITLTMTAWDIATSPYWQAVVDAYEAQNPNVHVELIDVSSAEYQDKVNIMLSGGDETDIITVKDRLIFHKFHGN